MKKGKMKKLLFGLAVVALATTVNAAAAEWKWNTSMGQAIYAPGSDSDKVSGTAYIFLSTAAESVYNTWLEGKDWTASTLDTGSTVSSSGTIATKAEAFAYDVESLTAIFAMETTIDGEKYLFISPESTKDATGTGAVTLPFSPKVSSQTAALDSYAGAGHWYSAPEPTSGLLVLMGLAGLMLRRKRA